MTFVSYAQNFEDVMLRRALGHVEHGFYVDVGAQHPVKDSVTKAFSLHGWRGINIEPVKHWFDMLAADRPHDINLNLAVAESEGVLDLFEVEGTGLSTTDPAFAERHRSEGREVIARSVPTMTLDHIFDEYRVEEVHFLKVDCEGAERTALASCSLAKVRPWIVVVEATLPNSQVSVHEQWESLLVDRGYIHAYNDGLNRYYVAEERRELLPSFALPPNVFDDFVRVEDSQAHDGLNEAHVRLRAALVEAAEARSTSASLAQHLNHLDAQQGQWRETEHAERVAVTQERDALAASLADMESRLRQAEQSRAEAYRRAASASSATENEQVDELLRRQHELIRTTEALRAACEERDRHIASLISSTSWRITAPIRWVRIIIGRVVRGLWSVARPSVVRIARALRPTARKALDIPVVRSVARVLVHPDSRIGRRVRIFLFPQSVANQAAVPMAPSEEAAAVEKILRRAITRQRR